MKKYTIHWCPNYITVNHEIVSLEQEIGQSKIQSCVIDCDLLGQGREEEMPDRSSGLYGKHMNLLKIMF